MALPILVAARRQRSLRRGKTCLTRCASAAEHSRMRLLTAANFAPAAAPPVLGDEEIHLWFFPHWQKLRVATDAPTVRALLGAYLGTAPDQLRIERGAYGKPELGDAALQFNLAHTGNALLLALSRGIAVGVD